MMPWKSSPATTNQCAHSVANVEHGQYTVHANPERGYILRYYSAAQNVPSVRLGTYSDETTARECAEEHSSEVQA